MSKMRYDGSNIQLLNSQLSIKLAIFCLGTRMLPELRLQNFESN